MCGSSSGGVVSDILSDARGGLEVGAAGFAALSGGSQGIAGASAAFGERGVGWNGVQGWS